MEPHIKVFKEKNFVYDVRVLLKKRKKRYIKAKQRDTLRGSRMVSIKTAPLQSFRDNNKPTNRKK